MAKQLNVDMRFTADTGQAKQAITELQSAIQQLGYGTASNGVLAADFEKASAAARELAFHLNNAYNAKTGNLDLSKLNQSLQSSGTNLAKLTANFKNAGEAGQQAFIALSSAIASADQPTITLNTHLATLWTTLKNVARFQISSSIIHGLIGGMQQAYGYAQDLNQSLNNIRIVTGQSTEQMARFADKANQTARSLSATTLDYTNASLIYYQQGLDDEAVKARTDVTVKLANVSRQSAEEVSNQMTAIWNNFDNGAHSMEYFADVITALGATTASSSEEIATGLEKFAPVAGTIGLSYEKATAALATIVATTRQSAETVGTGLRTIFSRFESLKLGETLEDGVGLTKYTNAMKTIGVDVLNANGELKDMDTILEQVASRWSELNSTQKTAFATTVGGVRQYTNLIALFDNWDKMQENMLTVQGAEGTLQNQADIYAESWEAARDRVQAALEALYQDILKDNFFITLTKGIEQVLGGIDKFIDGFGGIKNIVLAAGAVILGTISGKIGPAIQKMVQDIQIVSGGSGKVYGQMQRDFSALTEKEIASGNYDDVQKAQLASNNMLLQAKTHLGMVNDQLSAKERMQAELAIQGMQMQAENVKKLAEEKIAADKKVEEAKAAVEKDIKEKTADKTEKEKAEENARKQRQMMEDELRKSATVSGYTNNRMYSVGDEVFDRLTTSNPLIPKLDEIIMQAQEKAYNGAMDIKNKLVEGFISGENVKLDTTNLFNFDELGLGQDLSTDQIAQYKGQIEILATAFDGVKESVNGLPEALSEISNAQTPTQYQTALKNLKTVLSDAEISADSLGKVLKKMGVSQPKIDNYTKAYKQWKQAVDEVKAADDALKAAEKQGDTDAVTEAQKRLTQARKEAADADHALAQAEGQLQQRVSEFQPQHTITALEGITQTAAGFGQLAMAVNSVKSALNTLNDESATTGEKITAVMMGISMAVPGIIGAYGKLGGVINGVLSALASQGVLSAKSTAALMANGIAAQAVGAGYDKATASIIGKVVADNTALFTTQALSTAEGQAAAAAALEAAGIEADAAAKIVAAIATGKLTVANIALKASMIEIVAIIALVAAAIAGIIYLFKQWYASTPEGKLKAANEELERMTSLAEDCNNKYENLLSTISNYESARAGLEGLEAGTAEFNTQLEKANQLARELIGLLGLVEGNGFHFDNGQIIIDTGSQGYKDAVYAQQQRREEANTALTFSEYNQEIAQREVDRQNAIKQYSADYSDVIKGYIAEIINGERTGYDVTKKEFYAQHGVAVNADDSVTLSADNGTLNNYWAIQRANKDWETFQNSVLGNTELFDLVSSFNNFNNLPSEASLKSLIVSNMGNESAYQTAIQNGIGNVVTNLITPDILEQALNADSNEYLAKTLEENQNDLAQRLYGKNYNSLTEEQRENIGSDNASISRQLAQSDWVSNYTDTILNQLESYNNILDKAGDNKKLAAALINGTDLSQAGFTLEELKAMRENSLSLSNEEWFQEGGFNALDVTNQLDAAIKNWRPPPLDLSEVEESISNVNKITKKLEAGSNISAEDYATLGEAAEGYFTRMSDGTWTLTGDVEAFLAAVQASQLSGLGEALNTARNNQQYYEDTWFSTAHGNMGMEQTADFYQDWINNGRSLGSSTSTAGYDFATTMMGSEATENWSSMVDEERIALMQQAIDKFHEMESAAGGVESQMATMATTVGELQDIAEDYGLSQDAINDGYKNLATQTEEGKKALQRYNREMQGLDKNSDEARRATEKFQKAIKDIQANKAAEAIRAMKVNLDKLSDFDAEEIGRQLQSVFGSKITGQFIKDHKDWVKQWLNGTEEQRQAAANMIDNCSGLIDIMEQYGQEDIKTPEGLEALQNQLETSAECAELFANHWQNMKELVEKGSTELDGIKFNIDGTADMTGAIQSMLAAGATAQQVAQYIEECGLSHVQFTLSGTPIPDQPDISDIDAWIEWFNNNIASHAPSDVSASGEWSANAGKPEMTGGGGGGGGGGGNKKKKHDTKERDGGDRYRPIRAKQDDKKRQIDTARDKADRLAGKARIDSMREENKLLGENIDLQRQYLDEIYSYLAEDKKDMISQFADFGIKFKFDENGVIENYDAIMDKMYDIYNKKANQNMSDEEWEKFEEQWQDAIDALEQYVETRDLAEEQQANLAEMLNEQFDQFLKIIETGLELEIQVNDQDLQLLDHLINKIDDDAYKAAQAIALMGDKAGRELERIQYYQNAIDQTLAAYGVGSIDQLLAMSPEQLQALGITQETVNNLISWNNELLSSAENLDEIQKQIRQKVIDAFEELNEKVQKSYDLFGHYNTVLETYRNIADLNTAAIGKEARELIKNLDNSMLQNSKKTLRASKAIYDQLVQDRLDAEAKLKAAVEEGRLGDAEGYQELLDTIDEKIRESQEQWLADWEAGLQKAKDVLERSVDDAVKNYEELLAPLYGTVDALNDVYEMRKEVDADYVQDYEKLYQLNKLNRDLSKTLNDVQGIQNRKQLLALQEKINKLQKDGTKMSEYDLEVLEKEFEVQQARIALEEAANAKSTVRLQRDNEGNWGYVYTADADTIEEAQQNYEDKLYEYQKLNDEYIREMEDKLMDLSSTAKEKIAEVWADSTLTEEEKQAKTNEIVRWFNAQRDFISSQMQTALDNQKNLTQRFYDTYQNTYAEVMDTYEETMLAEATKIDNLNSWLGILSTGFDNLLKEVMLASKQYLENIEEMNVAAGSSTATLATDIGVAQAAIDSASKQNVDTVNQLADAVRQNLSGALSAAIDQETKFAAQIAATTTEIERQAAALNDVLRALNDLNNNPNVGNPLDTIEDAAENYTTGQEQADAATQSANSDYTTNKAISGKFNNVYDEEYWEEEHRVIFELEEAMKDWIDLLQLQALTAMDGFGTFSAPIYSQTGDTLEQNVHIDANFPNVTNSSEIEEAFENLVNKAA